VWASASRSLLRTISEMRNFLGRARPAKRRVALQLRVAVGPDIARGGLTNDHLFSVGGEVLDQNGDAATIVVGETLELELRVNADDTVVAAYSIEGLTRILVHQEFQAIARPVRSS